ncbi:HD domain [Dillenia turbinata]|uniref:5'-deoxynucleotidase n=1 Tax=Dillenia turbinata TaxID=194707 RepID=A0AAN8ZPX1_9MAGN
MRIRSRALWCSRSSSLGFLPSLTTSTHHLTLPSNSKPYRPLSSSSTSRVYHMSSSTNPEDLSSSSSSSASSAIDFLSLCHRLKTTKRAGWVKRDVKNPESIADHMYRMGLMALISSDIPGVDRDKCVKMAIVHDIAEAKEIADLWMEYEENSSPEAKVVKDFDKLEMILQAQEYENDQGIDLEEFFQSTAGKFQTELGKAWASEIASRRKNKK